LTRFGGHPRGSGFGCLAVKPESFGFYHFAAWLGPAEIVICDKRGRSRLNPRPAPFLAVIPRKVADRHERGPRNAWSNTYPNFGRASPSARPPRALSRGNSPLWEARIGSAERGSGGGAFKHGIAAVPVSWASRTSAGARTRSLLTLLEALGARKRGQSAVVFSSPRGLRAV
jgi:hypothetical protein